MNFLPGWTAAPLFPAAGYYAQQLDSTLRQQQARAANQNQLFYDYLLNTVKPGIGVTAGTVAGVAAPSPIAVPDEFRWLRNRITEVLWKG